MKIYNWSKKEINDDGIQFSHAGYGFFENEDSIYWEIQALLAVKHKYTDKEFKRHLENIVNKEG